MISILMGIVAVVVLSILFLTTYKVVGTNEAHVIVFMGRGRKIKSPVVGPNGERGSTAYFFIPFLMKRYIMPLTNVKLDITNIQLNDIEVAPFVCDVVTWLHIEDPIKAAERLDFTSNNVFSSLHEDLNAIVQAVARAAAMKQEILEIMRDRATFAKGVSAEVDGVLKSWGVQLVNLEVNDIRDQEGSAVIQNYESIRKAAVQSIARIEVAKRDREAVEKEQENKKLAEIATAEALKESQTAVMNSEKAIGIAEQQKNQDIATAEKAANETKVEALRTLTVGEANVVKEAAIVTATGEGEATRIKGEKDADVIKLTGTAEGEAIKAKGLAEAEAKLKMAEALKQFNDAATGIEKINAWKEVQKAFAGAYGLIANNADIKIVTGGEGANILGLPMNAKTGADFGQMIEAFGGLGQVADVVEKVASVTKKTTE